MRRLGRHALADLPADVARSTYDLDAVRIGIVHLGAGAFHRAHQAVYTEARLADEPQWAIAAASLRSPAVRDALAPQDGLYALAERGADGERLRVVGSLRRLLVAPEDPAALLAQMADPAVRIVSLTVTEKGYCHDPATGALDPDHADIRRDLEHPGAPGSAPGFLVEALARRRAAGTAPFTVLCCDNLPANGATVRRIVLALARLRDPELAAWIEGEVTFPATMVDRIVPATADADRAAIAARLGAADAWPVVSEPFCQWVIEDDFPSGRPSWDEAGAQLVADVAPFETMKLRLLNGSHSALAYLGHLAGKETVADAMREPAIARYVQALMADEIAPTLAVPPGVDLAAYRAALIARFANPALGHRTWQIAMDGSQKLPQRLLDTVRDRLRAGAGIELLAAAIAAWMRYVGGIDDAGRPIDVRDPLADRLRRASDPAGFDPAARAVALMGVREVFGDDLPADPRCQTAIGRALARLSRDGALATLADLT